MSCPYRHGALFLDGCQDALFKSKPKKECISAQNTHVLVHILSNNGLQQDMVQFRNSTLSKSTSQGQCTLLVEFTDDWRVLRAWRDGSHIVRPVPDTIQFSVHLMGWMQKMSTVSTHLHLTRMTFSRSRPRSWPSNSFARGGQFVLGRVSRVSIVRILGGRRLTNLQAVSPIFTGVEPWLSSSCSVFFLGLESGFHLHQWTCKNSQNTYWQIYRSWNWIWTLTL